MDFGGALSTGILIYLTIGMLIQIFTFPETVRRARMQIGPLAPPAVFIALFWLVILWPSPIIRAFLK